MKNIIKKLMKLFGYKIIKFNKIVYPIDYNIELTTQGE